MNGYNNTLTTTTIIIIVIIMMMMMMIMTIMIIIIIAFKGAIRDFLQSPQCAADRLEHLLTSGPGTVVCKSRATHRAFITSNMRYVSRGTN